MASNGFDPKANPKPQPQTAQASGQTSSEASSTKTPLGGEDAAYRAQVAAEIAQIRNEVQGSLVARAQGIQAIADEYQSAAQPVVDQASAMLYDVLSGGSFFDQIARNVGQLMEAHPTGPRTGLVAPTLKPVSFAPLQQGTQSAYLTSSDGPSNTASHG
jgi:hypothetical protein